MSWIRRYAIAGTICSDRSPLRRELFWHGRGSTRVVWSLALVLGLAGQPCAGGHGAWPVFAALGAAVCQLVAQPLAAPQAVQRGSLDSRVYAGGPPREARHGRPATRRGAEDGSAGTAVVRHAAWA
jgi:hypothetical protein